MKVQADKQQENKHFSESVAGKRPESEAALGLNDQRPEAVMQQQLQNAANHSHKVKEATLLQAKADNRAVGHAAPIQPKMNRTGLPDDLKSGIENLSGYEMNDVRVHYNSDKPQQLQAHAYAQGTDIHIAPGQEVHLPHEAWHVVQQKQGRVQATAQLAGVEVNGDTALEQEADHMGGLALDAGREPESPEAQPVVRQRKAVKSARSVFQLAAPGGIEHATNSCFVAALINTFTVVRPLRNLLIPTNNVLVNVQALNLQDLLWRAVNTVHVNHRVPSNWVRQIMASLSQNRIIRNAADTADFSNVIAAVTSLLTPGDERRGQTNNMPVSTGEVAWYRNQTLQDAVSERITQQQTQFNNYNLTPNSVHVTRGIGNAQSAPRTFDLYPTNGTVVTYRLRSIIERSDKYVGGHFISHVDRGDVAQEWWRSDDLNPGGVANTDIVATNMQTQGYAFIYERSTSALEHSDSSPEVTEEAQEVLNELYRKDLNSYLIKEMGIGQSEKFELDKVDTGKYDKDTKVAKVVDKDPVVTMENVARKIKEFNECSQIEQNEIAKVNLLMKEYSRVQTLDLFDMMGEQVVRARETIRGLHHRQAELIGQYLAKPSTEDAKLAFLSGIIPGFKDSDSELFATLTAKLTDTKGNKASDAFMTLRNRYLAYTVQALGTKTGRGRLEEFSGLIGRRNIRLNETAGTFGGGFSEFDDVKKGQKQEKRNKEEDLKLLESLGNNIPLFIQERFGKAVRTPGAQKDQTGDVEVYFEKEEMLFPGYIGQVKGSGNELFTSPLFTAMHHETGHLVNYLKGTSGGENSYKRDGNKLSNLTDEEEVHNITLDQYSDKAMSDEMALPERIAHGSYLGMDFYGRNPLREEEVYRAMEKWKGLSGQEKGRDNLVRTLQTEIRALGPFADNFHRELGRLLAETREWLVFLGSDEPLTQIDKQRLADALAWCVDQLEHKVYDRMAGYQRSRMSFIKPDDAELVEMRRDLDLVQAGHRRYIQTIVAGKLELWVSGTLDDRRSANQDWRGVLSGKRGIRIGEGVSDQFRTEALSNIARLLSRRNGQKLVHSLLSAEEGLEINTPAPELIEKQRQALKLDKYIRPHEVEPILEGMFGGQAGPKTHGLESAKVGKDGLEHNTGTPSNMSMRTGLTDSGSLSVNESGRLIFSPNFIELGHEMIHALQNLRGANVNGQNSGRYKNSAWDNMSEHSVIAGTDEMRKLLGDDFMTENMLREDHNLGVRYGHNTVGALKDAIFFKFRSIVLDNGWDTETGVINKEAPKGIVALRKLLTAPGVDWATVKRTVDERANRNFLERINVSKRTTTFYIYLNRYCDLLAVKTTGEAELRNFLEEIKNYNPFPKED